MSTTQALLRELPEGETISLPWVRERIGWTRDDQSYAVRSGAVRPLPQRGGHGGYQITREDAILIFVAAAIALAAGVAIVAMIRALRESGLDPKLLAQSMKVQGAGS